MAADSTHTSRRPLDDDPEGIYRALLYLEGQARQVGLKELAGLIGTAAEEARRHINEERGNAVDD